MPPRKVSTATNNYNNLRQRDKIKDLENIYKIDFNKNYNTPVI